MIISKDEFKELGFLCEAKNEELLESCIKRAEHILNALCGGVLASAMAQSKGNASLVKQAVAFEADALIKAESVTNETARVSLGDLSYTESSESSESSAGSVLDVPQTVKRLLCAAGCYPCTAAEVRE